MQDRKGLLVAAGAGLLFLDEIGELGLDEQGMLLRAVEEKRFLPVGSDREVRSDFQLIAGTNRDLSSEMGTEKFREDLFARINLWTFCLPSLSSRREDIEPKLEYELAQFGRTSGRNVSFNKEAHERFLTFAQSPEALWTGNFRDLNAAIKRMATLSSSDRIGVNAVNEEIDRLRAAWRPAVKTDCFSPDLSAIPGFEAAENLDRFDRVQLEDVISLLKGEHQSGGSRSYPLREIPFSKETRNDSDRLRKYLQRRGITWESIRALTKG